MVLLHVILSNYSVCQKFFSYSSGVFQKLSSVSIIRRSPFQNISSFQVFSFVRSHICTGASFKLSLISSRSLRSLASWFTQVSLFVFKFFLVIRSLLFVRFHCHDGSLKDFTSVLIISIHSFFLVLPVVQEDLPKFCAISPLNLFEWE